MTVANLTPTHLGKADGYQLSSFPAQDRREAALLLDHLRMIENRYNSMHPDHPLHGGWPRGMFFICGLVAASIAVIFSLLPQSVDEPVRVFSSILVAVAVVGAIGSFAIGAFGGQIYRLSALKKHYKEIEPSHKELVRKLSRL